MVGTPAPRGMTLTDGAILGLFFIQRYRFLTIDQFARAANLGRTGVIPIELPPKPGLRLDPPHALAAMRTARSEARVIVSKSQCRLRIKHRPAYTNLKIF